MGGGEAMAVIGIGTTSRASVEDVLAIIAAAKAKMAEGEFVASPSPLPLSREGRGDSPVTSGTPSQQARPAPSPLAGEGWGEGEQHIKTLATLDRPALNAVLAEAAQRAGLDLVLLTLEELREAAHLCVTHSEHSMTHYGIPSVAEAAALAGGGRGRAAFVAADRWTQRNGSRGGAAMTVHFIGAGPGAADLITLRGLEISVPRARLPLCRLARAAGAALALPGGLRASSTPRP